MAQNPFYVSGPVTRNFFVGRSLEIKIAFDQINKRAHIAFYGGSGTGKSSLLNVIADPATWQDRNLSFSEAYIVALNCTDINPFNASNFFREILELLRDQVSEQPQILGVIDTTLAESAIERGDFRKVLREIRKQEKFLLLLLDDFDWALRASEVYTETDMLIFLNEFRNLCVSSEVGQCLSTVVTSFRPIDDLGPKLPINGSPWYNHYLFHAIRPFSHREIKQHFFRSDSPLYLPLVEKLQPAVLQLTNGNPALLQNAFYLLYDTMQAEQTLEEINTNAFAETFTSRTEHFFRDTWKFSTDQEQVLLMLIALELTAGRLNRKEEYSIRDIDLIFSQRSRELLDLEERGIIKKVEDEVGTQYSFASALMEWWVIQEILNGDEDEIERREKVFLKWMSREQVEHIKTFSQQVWQQREVIKGAIEWIVSLIGKAAKA
jgi:hypothetical protein